MHPNSVLPHSRGHVLPCPRLWGGALSRAIGYRVLRKKHRKHGDIVTCGFPANQLDTVLQRIREAGGEVEQTADKTFLFRGLDGTPDEKLIAQPKNDPSSIP